MKELYPEMWRVMLYDLTHWWPNYHDYGLHTTYINFDNYLHPNEQANDDLYNRVWLNFNKEGV